jgi:hypothetical protein
MDTTYDIKHITTLLVDPVIPLDDPRRISEAFKGPLMILKICTLSSDG